MFKNEIALPAPSIRILFALIFIFTMASAGCASWDDRDPRPPKLSLPEFSDGKLQKKIALSLFDNQSQLPFEEIEQAFLLPLNNLVKEECRDMLLFTPYDPAFPGTLAGATRITEKGHRDNMAIAQTSRSIGLGAVVTGRISNIIGFEREEGFWLFKASQHYERIMILVDTYAAETGAKLLSKTYSREVEISAEGFQALARGTVENSPVLMETFLDLAEEIADDVCEIMDNIAWISFVTRVDGNTVFLASGADAGLEPGIRLELYSSNRVMQTRHGGRFFVPGTKTGEIEITAVTPHSARATLLPEANAEAGYTVRLR